MYEFGPVATLSTNDSMNLGWVLSEGHDDTYDLVFVSQTFDDVLDFPATGEVGKTYFAESDNESVYIWDDEEEEYVVDESISPTAYVLGADGTLRINDGGGASPLSLIPTSLVGDSDPFDPVVFFHWVRANETRTLLGLFSLDPDNPKEFEDGEIHLVALDAASELFLSDGLIEIAKDPTLPNPQWGKKVVGVSSDDLPINLGIRIKNTDDSYEGNHVFALVVYEVPVSGLIWKGTGGAGAGAPGMRAPGMGAGYSGSEGDFTQYESSDIVFIEAFVFTPSLQAVYENIFEF